MYNYCMILLKNKNFLLEVINVFALEFYLLYNFKKLLVMIVVTSIVFNQAYDSYEDSVKECFFTKVEFCAFE